MPKRFTLGTFFATALTCGILTCGTICICTSKRIGYARLTEQIRVRASDLDFGTIFRSPRIEHPLHIENLGASPISITGFERSCSCTSVSPETLIIQPGAQAKLLVTVRPQTGGGIQEFTSSLQPLSPGWDKGDVTWRLRGRIKDAVRIKPPQLHLSGRIGHLPDQHEFGIEILEDTIDTINSECPAELGQVTTASVVRKHFRGQFQPNRNLTVRRHYGTIRLVALKDGVAMTTLNLPVVINVEPHVTATPSAVVFGALPIGSRSSQVVTFRADKDIPRISVVDIPGDSGLQIIAHTPDTEPFQLGTPGDDPCLWQTAGKDNATASEPTAGEISLDSSPSSSAGPQDIASLTFEQFASQRGPQKTLVTVFLDSSVGVSKLKIPVIYYGSADHDISP